VTQPAEDRGAAISPGSPLARLLDADRVPALSEGFAERVLAAAAARPAAALPPLRRTPSWRRWRQGPRVLAGAAGVLALASAAAATGVLERAGLPVPSASTVWARLAEPSPPPAKRTSGGRLAVARDAAVPAAPAAPGPVVLDGPVDTKAELEEVLRRIEAVRQGRAAARAALAAQRLDAALARRRAAGLPLPSPEEEAALRARIAERAAQRQQQAEARLATRRAQLEDKVARGEAVTPEDFRRPLPGDPPVPAWRQRLRELPPAERREALRRLPPQERRALMEAWQQRRAQRLGTAQPAAAPQTGAEPAPGADATATPDVSPSGTAAAQPPR